MAPKTWMYERGRWVEIRDPIEQEGSTKFNEALEQLGFYGHESLRFGDENGFHVDVHEADDPVAVEGPEGPAEVEFLAVVSTAFRYYPVFVQGLPSLVQLMGELRPMVSSELQTIRLEDQRERRREEER